MNWIYQFQLFLLDFDGLLVDTERLHFAAYVKMCQDRGYDLRWDFAHFCKLAHLSAGLLRNAIYQEFPKLLEQEPLWEVLYREKKRVYLEILKTSELQLMPGVEPFLKALEESGIKRCVVTNSSFDQVSLIKQKIPLLQTIPFWITRELYDQPKPDPECYLKAVSLFAEAHDKIIGFEDSLRGLQALQGASVKAMLISPEEQESSVLQFRSFVDIQL